MKRLFIALTAIVLALPGAALAQTTDAKPPAAAGALAEGVVRKVDMDAKKITIKHGPITNLDMPPMTMVFQVKDTALLSQVNAGDKVRFAADKVGGAYIVTHLEPAR